MPALNDAMREEPMSTQPATNTVATSNVGCIPNPIKTKGALIGNELFFSQPNGQGDLYSIPLNQAKDTSRLLENPSTAPGSAYDLAGDGFWYDRTSIYSVSQAGDVVKFDTTRPEGWKQINQPQVNITGNSMTSDPMYGLSFAARLDVYDSTTITILDTSNIDDPKIRTISPPPEQSQPARDQGSIFFVPVGNEGALVALGGQYWPANSDRAFSHELQNIDVLDIASKKWITVRSPTEGIPGPRSKFCGWVVPSEDGKSFSIVIHGGINVNDSNIYGDVWSLSVPTFTWTKIPHGGSDDELHEFEESHKRYNHVCMSYSKNFGIAIGGSSTVDAQSSCKRQTSTQPHDTADVLDFSSFQLVDQFDPAQDKPPYSVSSDVNTVPDQIASLFQNPLPTPYAPMVSAGGAVPTAQATAKPTASPSHSRSLSTGAIAGIALGALIVLTLALIGVLTLLRRRRRRALNTIPTSHTPPMKSASASASDSDEAENFVSAHAHHVEEDYRRSLSPRNLHVHVHGAPAEHQTAYGVPAAQMPGYEAGASRTFMAEELDSPMSTYSSSLLEDHDGQHRSGPARERRMSDVSSLAETVVEDEREIGANREPSRMDEEVGRAIGGDISPVVSPVRGLKGAGEDGFKLDRRNS